MNEMGTIRYLINREVAKLRRGEAIRGRYLGYNTHT
jgi:hypothetical protein